ISVGHTPDADDAFMFYGIVSGKAKSSNFKIKHVVKDIETLNKAAFKHELHITAVSAHAYYYLSDYQILRTGGSFGSNYGPIVLSKKQQTQIQLRDSIIAVPGKLTTAALLLRLALGSSFTEKEMSFELIPEAIQNGLVDAGLVIHEAQIAYDKSKFDKVLDLGSWWNTETNGLPLPLGINIASIRLMNQAQIEAFQALLRNSILYAINNIDEAVNYAMSYSRGQSKDMITKFIKMYVNDITVDMGKNGEKALTSLFEISRNAGLLPSESRLNFT
ncbi:MAG: MqnA/MqnD/SBP family protein, partial [Nitrososphaeraceae archaeon]